MDLIIIGQGDSRSFHFQLFPVGIIHYFIVGINPYSLVNFNLKQDHN